MTETLNYPGCPMAPIHRHKYDNGLRLLVKEVHTTPIVAVYFWCGTGSVNEPPELNGISHFFEHMFFKGTEKRGPLQMDREIKSLGGYNNAFTSIEYTAYYVVVPAQHFTLAFDILLDAVRNSVFAEEEIKGEREVILEEIKRKEDSPGANLFDKFQERVFAGTSYAQPVLGTPETLASMNRDSFKRYLDAFYRPDNMCVAVVGDVELDSVVQEVGKRITDWRSMNGNMNKTAPFQMNKSSDINRHVIQKDVHQTYWMFGHLTEGRKNPREEYVLDVLATVLSGGRSSRLYQRLVEKENLVTSIDAWNWSMEYAGLFGADAEFPSEKLNQVSDTIFEEFDRIRKKPIDKKSLERAKTRLTTGFAFGSETVSNIGRILGRYETITRTEDALAYVDQICSVTSEEILQVAQEQLDPNSYTVCHIEPTND